MLLPVHLSSVVCLSVCLSSVSVHPTQAVVIFCNISTAFGTLAMSKNFTEIVPGEPLRRGVKHKRVAKYSDFGHIEGYIPETVQDMR